MAQNELSIVNCTILKNGKLVNTNIYIKDGKIKKIGKAVECESIIEADENIVLPGLIDCHVHLREPGMTQKEDFYTGSCAAAAGGVTTVIDMPNTDPPTITSFDLERKRLLAKKSIVNFGFHFGVTNESYKEIDNAKNIASVKVYMNMTTGKLLVENKDSLEEIFKRATLISVHAEGEKVREAIKLAKKHKKTIYICHVSGKKELDIIKEEKYKQCYVEVTPHHLFLTQLDEKRLGAFGNMKPSLKTKDDQEALWDAINKGIANTICTDHAPHTIEEKKSITVLSGVPGLETMLPLLLDAVNSKKITLQKVVELCCINPAKIFGIKNKGELKEGYDADLVMVDMDLVKVVENNKLFTKCKWSPFNEMRLKGWPIYTIVNGNIVFSEDQIYNIKAKEAMFG